jgi:predicted small integral membrane protein
MEKLDKWQKEIEAVNNEERDVELELKNEDKVLGKIGLVDKLITLLQIHVYSQVDLVDYSSNFVLLYELCRKNSRAVSLPELCIFDYVTGNVKKNLDIVKQIMKFYDTYLPEKIVKSSDLLANSTVVRGS